MSRAHPGSVASAAQLIALQRLARGVMINAPDGWLAPHAPDEIPVRKRAIDALAARGFAAFVVIKGLGRAVLITPRGLAYLERRRQRLEDRRCAAPRPLA